MTTSSAIFTAAPSAPEGVVRVLHRYGPADFPLSSAVLCRVTSPLVTLAYGMIQRDIRCRIAGRDIGAGLIKIVRGLRTSDIPDMLERLQTWLQNEVAKAEAMGTSPERFYDQAECIRVFANGLDHDSNSVDDVCARIDLLFSDDDEVGSVRLSTIHRAKGLEWPTVFILDKFRCPSKYATLPWQQQQERNLMYVAITRAQESLVYINSDCWKSAEE